MRRERRWLGRAATTSCAGSSPRTTRSPHRLAGLRLVVVTGPRIDPASIGAGPGVEVHGFVPDLDRHLAASDVAIVQGGLTTTMELAAAGRPFVYVPLRNHFEQNRHVRAPAPAVRGGALPAL